MDATTIKSYIQTKQVPSFLIFTGPEWVVQKIYINKIAEVMNLQLKYIDSISDIYASLRMRQVFNQNSVYVVRDDKEITGNEKIQEQLQHGLLKNNILILLLTSVDKRTKFYKTYKETICEFDTLKPHILKAYIQREIELSDSNTEKLMEVCEYDYGRCLLEIDKIRQYGEWSQVINDDKIFELLLNDGTIYTLPKDAIFDLVDAILDRNINCFDLLEQSYEVGEATMVMLSVLYNNTKQLLQVQSCTSNDISKSTGLTSWQIKNAQKHLHKYKTGELVYIMRLVRECEKGIKIGTYEEPYIMPYLLTKIL